MQNEIDNNNLIIIYKHVYYYNTKKKYKHEYYYNKILEFQLVQMSPSH